MDHGTRTTRETIQAPSGERPQETTTSAGKKDPGQALVPAPFRARGHGDAPETVRTDGHRRVLVVHEWRAAVKTSPVHAVPIVDGAAAKVVEGRWRGMRVEASAHPRMCISFIISLVRHTSFRGEGDVSFVFLYWWLGARL